MTEMDNSHESNLLTQLKLTDMPVKVGKAKDRIQMQYGSKSFAFIKEAVQNGWDAKTDKNGRGWYMKFIIDTNEKSITIDDNGTTGIIHWNNYIGLWDSSKEDDKNTSGTMGQGKMTLLLGDYMITETKTIEKEHKFVIHTKEGQYDDNPSPEILEKSKFNTGTKIKIVNVTEEVLSEFLDINKIVQDIQLTWWKLLNKCGNCIQYFIDDELIEIRSPEISKLVPETNKHFENEIIINDNGDDILIKDFKLSFRTSDTPEYFEGVAINVNQQTIKRHKPTFLRSLTGGVLVGSCSVQALKNSQTANHCDFISTDPIWKSVKRVIDTRINQFTKPFRRKSIISQTQHRQLKKIKDQINQILQNHPEIPFLHTKHVEKRKKKKINQYLGKIVIFPSPHINVGDDIRCNIYLKKTDKRDRDLTVKIKLSDPLGTDLDKTYSAKSEMKILQSIIEGIFIHMEGVYVLSVNVQDQEGKFEERTKVIIVGKKKTTERGKIKSKKRTKIKDGEDNPGISTIRPFNSPGFPLEGFFSPENGIVTINFAFPTISAIPQLKGKTRELFLARAAFHTIIREAIRNDVNEAIVGSQAKKALAKFDELVDKLVLEWIKNYG